MLNVFFRMYIHQHKRTMWQEIWPQAWALCELWRILQISDIFIIISVQDTCAMTHMEARDQELGLSIYHRLRRLNSGCQACSASTCNAEPSSQHITLVFAFQVWEVVVLKVLSSLRLHYVMIRDTEFTGQVGGSSDATKSFRF